MAKSIRDFTDQELQAELVRRQIDLETPPPIVVNPDWGPLKDMVQRMIDDALAPEDGPYFDEDNYHYIFEKVMKTLYGKDFFLWFNKVFRS